MTDFFSVRRRVSCALGLQICMAYLNRDHGLHLDMSCISGDQVHIGLCTKHSASQVSFSCPRRLLFAQYWTTAHAHIDLSRENEVCSMQTDGIDDRICPGDWIATAVTTQAGQLQRLTGQWAMPGGRRCVVQPVVICSCPENVHMTILLGHERKCPGQFYGQFYGGLQVK